MTQLYQRTVFIIYGPVKMNYDLYPGATKIIYA